MDNELQPKKSIWRWLKWVLISIGAIVVIGLAGMQFFTPLSVFPSVEANNPPVFIQADFVDLDKIYAVSKFRSGMGHDFSVGSGETCRSMKHYYTSIDPTKPNYKKGGGKNQEWPKAVPGVDVDIFSPVDGKVVDIDINPKQSLGYEVKLTADSQPKIIIRLMHVQPIDGLKKGQKVKAGDKVGLVHANQSFDIVVASDSLFKSIYFSYFDVMPDSVFGKYQARGIRSRDDLIVTKEYRDAHPFECQPGSEEFMENYADGPIGEKENIVHLSGYDEKNSQAEER